MKEMSRYNGRCMTDNEIDTLSQLSQIEISEAERGVLSAAIDQMLEYFALMGDFVDGEQSDATAIERAESERGWTLVVNQEAREAVGDRAHDYTAAAPEAESGFFVVPHVI